MSKKTLNKIDYFEGHQLLAIVSHLTDFTLCHHINHELELDLAKYGDLIFALPLKDENSFSWFCFEDKMSKTVYYLLGNKGANGNLIPSQKTADYFLLIKNPLSDDLIKSIANKLRKIPNIVMVFDVNMRQIKNMDLLLETNELHEMEFVKKGDDKNSHL